MKNWLDGVIEAAQALKEGKRTQFHTAKGWEDLLNDRYNFYRDTNYRAKPEPKIIPLTPEQWLKALFDEEEIVFGGGANKFMLEVHNGKLRIRIRDYSVEPEELAKHFRFKSGKPCGNEVEE